MTLNRLFKILILLSLCTPCYASNVENLSDLNENKLSTLNDNFKALNDNANKSRNLLNSYFGADAILGTANGGTGKDWSAVPSNNIPYFSATGTMGNVGIGTTGQYLTYPPAWTTLNQNVAAYNTTAPLIKIFEDTSISAGNGIGVTNRTSPFARSGTVSVTFKLAAGGGAGTATAYVRKNGTQVGTTHSVAFGAGGSTANYSEDIAVSIGDYLEIYLTSCSNTCSINDFYISVGNPIKEEPVVKDNSARLKPVWAFGTGSPDGIISCNAGDLFSRIDCSTTTTCLYVCTGTGTTWTAK